MAITVIREEDFKLRKFKEELPEGVGFGEFVRAVFAKSAEAKGTDYEKNVTPWIMSCRVKDHGIPIFKTRFAGQRFDKGVVLGTCWGGRQNVPSEWFRKVPEEEIEMMEEGYGDWRKILLKHGGKEQYEQAMSAPLEL